MYSSGTDKVTATGGYGDYSVTADGFYYDGNKTVQLVNYKVIKPSTLPDDFWGPAGYGQATYSTADNSK